MSNCGRDDRSTKMEAFVVSFCPKIVYKFYANMYVVREDYYKAFLMVVDIEVDVEVIDTFCKVPHAIDSSHPYLINNVPMPAELCLCFSDGKCDGWNTVAFCLKHLTLGKRMLRWAVWRTDSSQSRKLLD